MHLECDKNSIINGLKRQIDIFEVKFIMKVDTCTAPQMAVMYWDAMKRMCQ